MMKNLLFTLTVIGLSIIGMSTFAQTLVLVQEPTNLAGSLTFTDSFTTDQWGADLDTTAVTAEAAFAFDDGSYVDPVDGAAAGDSAACGTVINTAQVAGKVAFIYRGICNFSLKAFQAQEAGAVGCVIVNNEPGALIGMLAGDNAEDVHIPVVFISDADGAALRDSIIAGGVEVFLGNPNGVFANNVGAFRSNIGIANSGAIPSTFAQTSSDFFVPISAWVFNFGSDTAENVIVNTVIDRDGTEVYNETSTTAVTIVPADSLLFALPDYSENGYAAGNYTITYNISADGTDELLVDNTVTGTFFINENGLYSKSRIDPVDGPISNGGSRPGGATPVVEFEWCTPIVSENASAMQVHGVEFAIFSNDTANGVEGYSVFPKVYQWNDVIDETSVTFNSLDELTNNEVYDFFEDLEGEFVTHAFAEPIQLEDNQKYLSCIMVTNEELFIGTDGGVDYSINYDNYPAQVFFPLQDLDAGTWFAGGLGADAVPAIITRLHLINGIADDFEGEKITPYPNPTVDMINIPFPTSVEGTVMLNVFSVNGQLVKSEELCLKNSNQIRVDVTELSSGIHTFNLTFEDESTTSFQVVISK